MSPVPVDVVAAVLRDPEGRILLSQRPPNRPHAGLWEFPGGKVEPGESASEALARELHEELGIRSGPSRPLAAIHPTDAQPPLRLWLYEVLRYDGDPVASEGQTLAWVPPEELEQHDLLPADRYLARVLQLDGYYAIAPPLARLGSERALLDAWDQCLDAGFRLLGLRLDGDDSLSSGTIDALAKRCSNSGARWLVSGPVDICRHWPVHGLHLETRPLVTLQQRPVGSEALLLASCHDLEEIRIAEALGADLVTLSPVNEGPGAANLPALGWEDFARVLRRSPLPVLASGGMRPEDWARARELGAFGVAGSRAFGWT